MMYTMASPVRHTAQPQPCHSHIKYVEDVKEVSGLDHKGKIPRFGGGFAVQNVNSNPGRTGGFTCQRTTFD
jgi:hypothetical protein